MISFLGLYGQINLLIALSFLSFRLGRKGMAWLGQNVSHRALTRSAQLLLIGSILFPLAFALTPARKLPRLEFSVVHPVAEGSSGKKSSPQSPRASSSVRPKAQAADFSVSAEWQKFRAKLANFERPEIVAAWLLGFFLVLLRLGRNFARLHRLLAGGVTLRRVGRAEVLVADGISVPFSTLLGFRFRAYAVIPAEMLSQPRHVKLAVQHEFQHHRQRDTAWAILSEFLVCAFYVNPAIYLWKKEITELQEFSCDEALLGQRRVSPREYGSCLIRVAEAALGNRQMLAGTACMAADSREPRYLQSFLGRRIEMFSVHEQGRGKKSLAILLGTLGLVATATVAYGAQQILRSQPDPKPNPGHAVFDPVVQSIAEEELGRAVRTFRAKGGFVLVSDPQTGKLLAAANVSQVPARRGAWSLSYRLEPASVIKSLTLASAAEKNVAAFDELFNCENGNYKYGNHTFHDWKPFGQLSAVDTVVYSSNICGIKIGERLGSSGLARSLEDFGFGPRGTTENFPEALAGSIPKREQLTEEEYVALVGTGYATEGNFHVTPLEMVQAYGAIANGGNLMKPLAANEADSSARVVRRVLSAEISRQMKVTLRKAVEEGTGGPAKSRLYTTAGETGSAYPPGVPEHPSLGGERAIASFAGFAPVDHPRVAIYVGVIDPTNSKDRLPHGSEHAAPVFREVAERVLRHLNVAPE